MSAISYTVSDRLHSVKAPKVPEFDAWLDGLSRYLQALVEARLARIQDHGTSGTHGRSVTVFSS